ncbi:MAG: diguanylate cyclase [Pirellulaceae bacterium]|nr:diguanylate cyclase [Pirellulaceae bacterium]
MKRFKTTIRLSFMLAGLSLLPYYLFGMDRIEGVRLQRLAESRSGVCQQLAVATSLHMRRQDSSAVKQQLEHFCQHTASAVSARIVRFDGHVVSAIGPHDEAWHLKAGDGSDVSNIRITIRRDGRDWGSLEAAFGDSGTTWSALMYGVLLMLAASSVNFISFFFVLKRTLKVLDPSNSVPRRVKNTLDTIAGGVVVLDAQQRIVLANEAFARFFAKVPSELVGETLDAFDWQTDRPKALPWHRAIERSEACSGETLSLVTAEAAEKWFVVNATPVYDSNEKLAGALISFEDVTILEEQRQSLVDAMQELEASREQIRAQNNRLRELASRDALTGIMNRRELFERLEQHWVEHKDQGIPFGCMMLDVDHFKKLNDTHGHAVGDLVLKNVARTLESTVGDRGIVARYGGEEFCVVAQHSQAIAEEIGEAVRRAIAVGLATPYAVTTSVGISHSSLGAQSFQEMLEQADKALYAAKHGGRNACRSWSSDLEQLEMKKNEKAAAKKVSDVQAIPYHAVASLHAALAYRDADTASHCQRVAEMSVALGRGLMSVTELYVLEIGGLLHDIGKIGVPDSVLLKPDRLTPEEWKIMETHARVGVEIVNSSFDCADLTAIVQYHHCRFDGLRQAPDLPIGKDIPLGARIVSIVDAFDAMVTDRVYRPGRPAEQAFEELRRCAGTQFDGDLVERFVGLQLGWRLDSRHGSSDLAGKLAISIGQQTERIIRSFESRQRAALCEQLNELGRTAAGHDLPGIAGLAQQLTPLLADIREEDEWKQLLPIVQDLIEMCLTIQRAHIRDLGARPLHLSDS